MVGDCFSLPEICQLWGVNYKNCVFNYCHINNLKNFSYVTFAGSKLIRSSVPYQVSVTSDNLEDSAFSISIDGKDHQGQTFVRTQNVSLTGSQSEKLVFDVSFK